MKSSNIASDPFKAPRVAILWALACVAVTATFFLAARYPLAVPWLVAPLLLYAVIIWIKPEAWLFVVPAILPVFDLTPWTGWIFVEELDLVFLITLAVGYVRVSARPAAARYPLAAKLLFGLLAFSYLLSMFRGLSPLPAFDANALSNYASPYHALRIAKGFFWALLFIPLLSRTVGSQGENLERWFFSGLITGIAAVSIVAIWERAAFPGIMNFSADYRTTASFSGMHTGGAALDGFMALCMPATCLLLLPGRSLRANALGLLILAAGTYTLLTTFSRGLYLGYALSAVVVLVTLMKAFRTQGGEAVSWPKWRRWVLSVVLVLLIWMLYRVFGTGGYRVLAAILIFAAGAFYVGGRTDKEKGRFWWPFALIPLVGVSLLVTTTVPKGAYLVFGAATAFLLAIAVFDLLAQDKKSPSIGNWLRAGVSWVGISSLFVAQHWGGAAAVNDAVFPLVLGGCIALGNQHFGHPLWRFEKRAAMLATVGGVALAMLIPIMGNYYSQERFSHVGTDLQTRKAHWEDVVDAMSKDSATTFLGMGLGRFPAEYFWRNKRGETPGSFQFMNEAGNQFVRLAGPRYAIGYGEVLRFGQRISVQTGEIYRLALSFRTTSSTGYFQVGLCEKLLLYSRICNVKTLDLKPADGLWHEITADFNAASMNDGPWYLPRPVQLWVANGYPGTIVDIDSVRLLDTAGRDLVRNGAFDHGNDFWFYSSDTHHLPWHAKDLWLNVYFDQGWFGVTVFTLLLAYVVIRLLRHSLMGQPLAGILLASILAFLAVGLFDSLIDVPRIGTLFYLVLLSAIYLTTIFSRSKLQHVKERSL